MIMIKMPKSVKKYVNISHNIKVVTWIDNETALKNEPYIQSRSTSI
jgi:hypothetical protein